MWRSFFLALAVTLCLLGLECLVVKKATLTLHEPPPAPTAYGYDPFDPTIAPASPAEGPQRVIEPPEWAPFGLLSSGIVLLLYSKSLGG